MSGAGPRAGEEAARLLVAAQDWLRTSAPHLAPLADDGEPCSCPLCKAVVGLREADPETVVRWVDSAVSAVTSFAAQLSETGSRPESADGDGYARQEDEVSPDHDLVADDERATSGSDSRIHGGPEHGTGQDVPGPRGLRRIPLERDEDPTSR